MRLYIKLSKNKTVVPFSYQHFLTGVVQKWIGPNNEEHGKSGLFSFSWLQNTEAIRNGLMLKNNAYFFISAYNTDLIKKIVKGIVSDPKMFCGIKAIDVQIKTTPMFTYEERFFMNSPILIRQKIGNQWKYLTYLDEDFEFVLTENLKGKLKAASISADGVSVELDKSYAFPQTKLVDYKGINNKTTLAPIIIKGTPEQIALAWEAGLGNSTGIGFGSIK